VHAIAEEAARRFGGENELRAAQGLRPLRRLPRRIVEGAVCAVLGRGFKSASSIRLTGGGAPSRVPPPTHSCNAPPSPPQTLILGPPIPTSEVALEGEHDDPKRSEPSEGNVHPGGGRR
jgi:hypothetical protein